VRRQSKAIGQPSATTTKGRMTTTSHSMPFIRPAVRPRAAPQGPSPSAWRADGQNAPTDEPIVPDSLQIGR
jgi:hypothetical protein